nr:hypothetical protein [Tanacetum cinerariifolium]
MGTVQEPLAEGTKGAPHLGLPKDIYTLINHYTNAKDIWDNVKMLLEGSELTKEDRESQLMTMSRMQLNSKFVNNMLPEWGRFVTAVKLNRGLGDSNYDQFYAYLKQHKAYANENKIMLDRFTQHTVDPLALMSNVSHQQHYSQSSSTLPSTYGRQNRGQGTNLGVEVQLGMREFRTELGMLIQNSDYFKDKMLLMQAQENGVALDEERLLFLADDYDAFDSDVDKAPTAQNMFMANLSSADPVYD